MRAYPLGGYIQEEKSIIELSFEEGESSKERGFLLLGGDS
jgi:hypothetical protein